jgi:hypothetical protein
MKKTVLLVAAGIFFASSVSAQVQKISRVNIEPKKANATLMNAEVKKGPRKDLKSGVYYTRPEGSLYWGTSAEGSYYPLSRLFVPAFSEVKFKNMCNNAAAATWSMGGQNVSQYFADANNDLVIPFAADEGYNMPTIAVGSDTYMIGEKTQNPNASAILCDTIQDHAFVDQQTSKTYAFGSLSTGYLFGTGYFKPTEGEYAGKSFRSHGFVMECPAPISPLYIERFNAIVYSDSNTPIAEGKEVTMQLRNLEKEETEDGRVRTYPGAKILGEMKATKADLSDALGDFDTELTQTGHAWAYNITFSNKTVDRFGNIVDEPIVVNEPFFIVVRGHEQEGVNFGYRINDQPAEDALVYGTYALSFADDDPEMTMNYSAWYGERAVVEMSFVGGYDYVEVLESSELVDNEGNPTGEKVEGINVLRVSADGEEIVNEGYEGLQNNVMVNTAFPWLDGENYVCDLPEWITNITGESSFGTYQNGQQYYTGQTLVTVECEPLQAGETKRAASLYLEGRGYKTAQPIIVLQGDATIADAIENPVVVKTSMNKGTYNLAGQKVGKNFKGIVIKNGKKEIQK